MTLNPFARPGRTLLCLSLLVILSACGKEAPSPEPSEPFAEALADTPEEHARKHLDPRYVCPMHPQIFKDEPGSCPICGMNLVAKRIEAPDAARPEVQVPSAVMQSMGIRTARAKRDTLWKYIQTVGRVDYDETRLVHVHPRTEGWIERLKLRAEGDPVKRGELLGQLYSPEILSAQVDFLIALDQKSGQHNLEKARNRLRLLGVTEGTISRIQQNRQSQNTIPIYAPAKGVMTQLQAREGMYVKPEMEIFTIVDPSVMWVLVDVFEYQIDWLREGLTTEMRVPAYPGRTWEGKVDYIYPDLDPQARTLRVRLAFTNPDGKLKANMFAEVVIYGGPKHDVLQIPVDALIETGERASVIKALGGGRFQPVDVVKGTMRAGRVEILEGLEEGDKIVVSGQFLIDSESSLQASFRRMEE
ncbi:MAG: efflux RND transporter periplasmic adaptor subunit [Gammaproteobacteria bacterium]|nr:efflux RND transporter periplasmic adaptor subunit [Gammaproteobacteria bacterium]